MVPNYRLRRLIVVLVMALVGVGAVATHPDFYRQAAPAQPIAQVSSSPALAELDKIPIKGKAPKTGYARTQFGSGWVINEGCDTRNIILHRDLTESSLGGGCKVVSGSLRDPYTDKTILFQRGENTSQLVQIDHVVSLSNAWQTGAQQLAPLVREEFANDPLNLLAVDGAANQQKSDGDAATWLPSNKPFRCQYIARQIAVKKKYSLWIVATEKDAMTQVLGGCPNQTLPG